MPCYKTSRYGNEFSARLIAAAALFDGAQEGRATMGEALHYVAPDVVAILKPVNAILERAIERAACDDTSGK